MCLELNLYTKRQGEIKRFLESFYGKRVKIDDDVDRYVYIYKKPLEAVDIMSAVVDNQPDYKISMFIRINDGDIYAVTPKNCNDIIKALYYLYYENT